MNRHQTTSRSGSILIMVVALLVMIALIATAMLSTTRNDRFASKQNEANVQIDLLVKGATDIALGTIANDQLGDVNGTSVFRPGEGSKTNSTYDAYDAFSTFYPVGGVYDNQNDKWLMPRTPTLQSFNVSGRTATPPGPYPPAIPPGAFPPIANNANNLPIWQCITAPLATDAFESPALYLPNPQLLAGGGTLPPTYKPSNSQRSFVDASGVTQYARSDIYATTYPGTKYPALAIYNPTLQTPRFITYLAADCDGDNIADAMLQKLPMGPINGVTYYVAYRIVDGNSALNANTATSMRSDFGNTPAAGTQANNLALFPTNIGLFEILRRNRSVLLNGGNATLATLTPAGVNDDFYNLMNARQAGGSGAGNFVPDGVIGGMNPKDQPRDDGGAAVNSYRYLSVADALWHGLGRRLGNPGVASSPAANTIYRHAPFGVGDSMSLAYPFAWRAVSASKTTLETALGFTLTNRAPETGIVSPTIFNPADLASWYDLNFDWFINYGTPNTAQYINLRPIVTSFNPVSNASLQANLLPTLTLDYIDPVTGATLGAQTALVPFGNGAPRASLNTADFATLMRAYFSVMAEDWTGTADQGSPFQTQITSFNAAPPTPGAQYDPYHGRKWVEPPVPELPTYTAISTPAATSTTSTAAYQNPRRMFSSVLRAPTAAAGRPVTWANTTPRLQADQMVILRAAIAAANAKELRDADDDIYPVDVGSLEMENGGGARVSVRGRVYGLERQPYLCEVYVQTDDKISSSTDAGATAKTNKAGYIALQFYNPHPFPIDLKNCQLLGLDRSTPANIAAAGALALSSAVSNMTGTIPAGWSPVTIPAKGFLVLENYSVGVVSGAPNTATYRPVAMGVPQGFITTPGASYATGGGTYWAYVPSLENLVYNREITLVRPLYAVEPAAVPLTYTWVPFTATPGTTPPNAMDMAPLDSFDFSGLLLPDPNGDGYPRTGTTTATSHKFTNRATAWHYARRTPAFDPVLPGYKIGSKFWHFVYPGRYDAAGSVPDATTQNMPHPRHQGVQEDGYDGQTWFVPGARDPWEIFATGGAPPTGYNVAGVYPPTANNYRRMTFGTNSGTSPLLNDEFASYPQTFPIQLGNTDMPGPYLRQPDASTVGGLIAYPFGGFARNGDALDATFIGSYRIVLATSAVPPTNVVELNAVSMDAAMAEDTDVNDDPNDVDNGGQSREQIGRFCPLNQSLSTGVVTDSDQGGSYPIYRTDVSAYGDLGEPNDYRWRYRWASDLLEYVSVQSPNDDYAPNILPSLFINPYAAGTLGTPIAVSNSGSPASQSQNTVGGQPGAGVNVTSEVGEPIHGLVNINTASWQVLAMVPWFTRNASTDLLTYNPDTQVWTNGANTPTSIDDNAEMARAIVAWRDGDVAAGIGGHGPFKSLFDLYRVPAFRNAQVFLLSAAYSVNGPDDAEGDLSPFNYPGAAATVDDVRFDYEEQCLLFKRISNLLTTRSDSFTLYLIVQGWRNTGTTNPELVVQKRAAMIVDRSRSDGKNLTPSIYNIPTQP